MDLEALKSRIKDDFQFLLEDILGLVLYGSQAAGEADERSDIDICTVAPYAPDKIALSRKIPAGIRDDQYDMIERDLSRRRKAKRS